MLRSLLATAALLTFALPVASAHVPETGAGGGSRDAATSIPDVEKSWAFYGALGDAQDVGYYSFFAPANTEVWFQLLASPVDVDLVAAVYALGPGVPGNDPVPARVEAHPGEGSLRFRSTEARSLIYEPFTPSAMINLGQWSFTTLAAGKNVLAVVPETVGGRYVLAVGREESFTPTEWVLVPYSTLQVYAWSGQSLWVVALPAFVVMVAAVGVGWWRRRDWWPHVSALRLGALVSSVLFLAGAAVFLSQTSIGLALAGWDPAGWVSLAFVALSAAAGIVLLRIGLDRKASGREVRWWLVGTAAVGFGAILGYLVAPAAAVLSAFLPARPRRRFGSRAVDRSPGTRLT